MPKKRMSQNTAIAIGAAVGVALAVAVMAIIIVYYQNNPPAVQSSQPVQSYLQTRLYAR